MFTINVLKIVARSITPKPKCFESYYTPDLKLLPPHPLYNLTRILFNFLKKETFFWIKRKLLQFFTYYHESGNTI